jgi:hypothetical protein
VPRPCRSANPCPLPRYSREAAAVAQARRRGGVRDRPHRPHLQCRAGYARQALRSEREAPALATQGHSFGASFLVLPVCLWSSLTYGILYYAVCVILKPSRTTHVRSRSGWGLRTPQKERSRLRAKKFSDRCNTYIQQKSPNHDGTQNYSVLRLILRVLRLILRLRVLLKAALRAVEVVDILARERSRAGFEHVKTVGDTVHH